MLVNVNLVTFNLGSLLCIYRYISLGGSIVAFSKTQSRYCNNSVTRFPLILFSFFSAGIRVADQLLCNGAGQHCVSPGTLQWSEGGETMTENELFMTIHIRNIFIVLVFCAEMEIPFKFNYSLTLERKP